MNVSAWSIKNPVPAVLLFALLTLLGISSFKSLGIQNFPDIELPSVVVTATLEGAAPAQLETEVARKIEDKIATLGGVEHIRTTITDSTATVIVEYDIDQDTESALNDVRNAVDSVRAELPGDLNDPIVSKITTTGNAIVTFTVQSDHMDEEDLSWFVDNEVAKAVLTVDGVGAFSRIGGVDREISVELDPVKMAALNVMPEHITSRLKDVQKDASGGRGDIGGTIQSVRTLASVHNTQEIANLEIPLDGGRSVKLGEVATVKEGIAERSTYTFLDGKPAIAFNITRLRGVSEVALAQGIR
ncbi:MAG: efflux RND transporter permease subunit, partial [Gammaproteobacteria bacterium]|nr:efflux RND transporter permease subunit [Gammaproteobacteria bacterium]